MRYATEEAFRGGGINTRLRSLTIRRCRGMGLVADVLAEQFPALEQLTLDTGPLPTEDWGCRVPLFVSARPLPLRPFF